MNALFSFESLNAKAFKTVFERSSVLLLTQKNIRGRSVGNILTSIRLWLKSNESLVFPFLAFAIPLAVRAIPEILMGPYVVGFDTLAYYVPNTLVWLRGGVSFWNFLAVAPFFYVLLMGVTSLGVPDCHIAESYVSVASWFSRNLLFIFTPIRRCHGHLRRVCLWFCLQLCILWR